MRIEGAATLSIACSRFALRAGLRKCARHESYCEEASYVEFLHLSDYVRSSHAQLNAAGADITRFNEEMAAEFVRWRGIANDPRHSSNTHAPGCPPTISVDRHNFREVA